MERLNRLNKRLQVVYSRFKPCPQLPVAQYELLQ
jgi:hypothetical protein